MYQNITFLDESATVLQEQQTACGYEANSRIRRRLDLTATLEIPYMTSCTVCYSLRRTCTHIFDVVCYTIPMSVFFVRGMIPQLSTVRYETECETGYETKHETGYETRNEILGYATSEDTRVVNHDMNNYGHTALT